MNDKKKIMFRRSSRQIGELRTIQPPTPSPPPDVSLAGLHAWTESIDAKQGHPLS